MLTKLQFKPGINREITRYSGEGGWRACDKVRFRQGFPEKIGGWQQISPDTFLGTCRTLTEWVSLSSVRYTGVGTNLKYYVERGGDYYDITPLRATTAAGDVTFAATTGSSIITVSDTSHGADVGDFVTFSGAVSLGGDITATVLNAEYQIASVIGANSYTIDVGVNANASDTGNGGASVVGAYQLPIGPANQAALNGWGAGGWGLGPWGVGITGTDPLRLWNHNNYGEDLIYGPRGGGIYYWDSSAGVNTRGVQVTSSDTPTVHLGLAVSDLSRFVIAFGCNDLGSSVLDPLLVRWSDQEQYNVWTPAITNQAGGQRLSNGSTFVAHKQNRQEILIWTDTALYSMQYQGPPYVFGFQIMGDNLSIASPQAATVASGVAYWMGTDKFYKYDGRVQPLRCDLLRHVFNNINYIQLDQVISGTNEQFGEVWWFYPSANSISIDSYIVYNYQEDIWYYGSMHRTAWLDSSLRGFPVAAFNSSLLQHETGVDDNSGVVPMPIEAFIESSEVDIGDGDKFAFVRRVLPDVTFEGSTAANPELTMELRPLRGAGSGYTNPASVGGVASADTVRTATLPIQQFTNQINVRVRGRQIAIRLHSDGLGVKWQLGSPRVDLQPDGRRG
jgi:hypothetical protein